MLYQDPIRIVGPLGRIYSFTRRYHGDDFFEGPRLAFHHDRAYARDHLLRLSRSVTGDPFNYRLLDVWQLVFQKPWTRPRSLNDLVSDLTDKIHRGELFVYLEPNLDRNIPGLLKDGPPEGDPGFIDIGVPGQGQVLDKPRTKGPVIANNNSEPENGPSIHEVPQGKPEALKSKLSRQQLHRTVGLDTVVSSGAGGETLGAMYDKVYDNEDNQRPGVDLDTASTFDEAYLHAQDIRGGRAEGYKMAVTDAAVGAMLGPIGLGGSKLAVGLYRRAVARLTSTLSAFPADPQDMTRLLGVNPKKVSTTPDGTQRILWEPNSNTRIRFESHPHGLTPKDPGFNPRHHGEHFHVEIKPEGMSWNKATKKNAILKVKPEGYTPGSGTGFVAGEKFPGL